MHGLWTDYRWIWRTVIPSMCDAVTTEGGAPILEFKERNFAYKAGINQKPGVQNLPI